MTINNYNNSKMALLLFAQSESSESLLKPIAKTAKQNVWLWSKMNRRVVKTIQKTNLFYFHSNETNQLGETFGEKLTHAIKQVFEKGFQKVIVIGNDCPELKSNHLVEAALALSKNDIVLGANYHGGTYLMGITQSVFDAEKFSALHWQTPKVLAELKVLFQNNSLHQLQSLHDCNTVNDLKKIISKLSFLDSFKSIISTILFIHLIFTFQRKSIYQKICFNLNYNKGSPCFSNLA